MVKNLEKILFLVLLFLAPMALYSQSEEPDEPVLVSASVVPESDPLMIRITWEPSDSLDVAGYYVYQVIDDITRIIGTVNGRLTLTYEYLYTGVYKPEKYRLAAFTDRLLLSTITDPHTTMLLDFSYEKCDVEVELSWTEYHGWQDGVSEYRILRRSEASSYEEIGRVNGDILQFVDSSVERNIKYFYYVEAVNLQNHTATTNSIEVFTDSYYQPSYLLAEYATVEDEHINLRFAVDTNAEVLEYLIQRRDSANQTFTTIGVVENNGQPVILYTDNNADIYKLVYNYRIVSVDPCRVETGSSNIASNILLKVSNHNTFEQYLTWTPYELWGSGVDEYEIYNTFNYSGFFVGTADTLSLKYYHNIESYVINSHNNEIYIDNKLCYYVEAVQNIGIDGRVSRSRSNISCAYKLPEIWVPTAINAASSDEKNREFKPVLTFFEKDTYELSVFDRWGEEIFNSDNVYKGWNGRLKGKLVPSQQYQYSIKYKDFTGKTHKKIGTFFVIIK
jgi:gliding motility-associated-like protein